MNPNIPIIPPMQWLNGKDWVLTDHYSWRGVTIPIREFNGHKYGFVTDGGSIPPWLPRGIVDSEGKGLAAFLNHDYRYSFPSKFNVKGNKRKEADRLLQSDLIALGFERWRARLVYRAVRLGGWWPWLKSRRLHRHDNYDLHYARIPNEQE